MLACCSFAGKVTYVHIGNGPVPFTSVTTGISNISLQAADQKPDRCTVETAKWSDVKRAKMQKKEASAGSDQ
jgi:hypothetical protein